MSLCLIIVISTHLCSAIKTRCHRKRHARSIAEFKFVFAIRAAWFIGKLKYRACREARDKNNPTKRGNVENACVSTGKYIHIVKIDTRMRHGTNFIFSNRDLRSPQASAPSSSACPEMHCSGLLFSSREYFSPSLSHHRDFLPHPVHMLVFWYFERRAALVGSIRSDIFTRMFFFLFFASVSFSRPIPPSNFSPMFFFKHVWFRSGRSIPPRQGIGTRVESDSLSRHSRQTTTCIHTCTYSHTRVCNE